MNVPTPDLSILIPALNEAENLPVLIPRIARAVGDRAYEIIVIDDNSPDNTVEVCDELSQTYPLKLIVRPRPRHGLSGAVLEGMAQARGDILLVMDADLQHPPERIPALLEPLERNEADFTLGSRYIPGGGTAEHWGLFRRINSWVATALARPFSGPVHDPMSGFFALKRETYQRAERLTPLGYKIALELMCKCRIARPVEVPIHFNLRERGQSKLSLKQQFRYLEHLSRLYDFQYPRASPIVKFLIVLTLSWIVGGLVYAVATAAGVGRATAPTVGWLAAIGMTALFHARYVRTQRVFIVQRRPWMDFAFISICELAACWAASIWLAWRVPLHRVPELLIVPFSCATIVRYILRKELLSDIRGLARGRDRSMDEKRASS